MHTEHARIVAEKLRASDVVFDVFAGIGPFALPAAKKGCAVYANDLNPDSYSAMSQNIKLNKLGSLVTPYNLDGRDFIRYHRVLFADLYEWVWRYG